MKILMAAILAVGVQAATIKKPVAVKAVKKPVAVKIIKAPAAPIKKDLRWHGMKAGPDGTPVRTK